MALPKLDHPTFGIKLPSTGKEYRFRPYTVKEQKILLTIKDSDDEEEITELLTQLISSCCLTEGLNPKKLAYFDIEYIFAKLRAKSVGEIVELNYKCNNEVDGVVCGTVNTIEVNLDGVKVDMENSSKLEFEIGNGISVKMNFPSLKIMGMVEKYNQNKNLDDLIEAISLSIHHLKDEGAVYDDFTKEEMVEFISSLSIDSFEKFLTFFISLPKLKETVAFKCKKCGYTDNIVITGLLDFFV